MLILASRYRNPEAATAFTRVRKSDKCEKNQEGTRVNRVVDSFLSSGKRIRTRFIGVRSQYGGRRGLARNGRDETRTCII